jgi:hypothetical protein
MSRRIASLAAICFATIFLVAAASLSSTPRKALKNAKASGYHVAKTIPIGGAGGWDYATTDPVARRVYISHDTHVVVLDADTQEKIGDVAGTQRLYQQWRDQQHHRLRPEVLEDARIGLRRHQS